MPLAPQELRTFFITAVTANRRRLFQSESNAKLLLNLFAEDRAKNRYALHAFIIMPDHIHLLIARHLHRKNHAIHQGRILLPS